MTMTEAVVVAAIAAVGGVIVALVQSFRKENRSDHQMVVDSLNRIEGKVDDHIRDHARGKL
jgi:predicted histidine transporter YuiF (NhaC family)